MTAVIVLSIIAAYLAVGFRLAESVGRRSYQRAKRWSWGAKDIDGTIALVIGCVLAWPLVWPLTNLWERIRASDVDRETHEVLR